MRAFLCPILVTIASVTALAQSDGTTTTLSYRYYGRGLYSFWADATSTGGVCTVETVSSTGNGAARWTGPLDAAVFAKLMHGAKALVAARDPAQEEPAKGERHVIEITVRNKDGSKSDKYVVPDKDASEAVRTWAKLLSDSIPK